MFYRIAVTALVAMTASFAHAAPGCLTEIIAIKEWTALTPQQIECMSQHRLIKPALAGLCSADQAELSAHYKVYRGYETTYHETYKAVRATPEGAAKQRLKAKVVQTQKDWLLLGYKSEIESALSPVWSAKSDCESR